MKAAPMLLWLIAIVVPILTGRNIYLETFKFDQEQASSMARHQLMTRAREFEARLEPEKIIFQQLQLQASIDAFYKVPRS
ncbi:MAG: hypothetical protein PHV05_02750, partial [Candidatus Riflebacteria bacterium]|nr:hypothetical protein [Candidatus Riflebacteria bacterium]